MTQLYILCWKIFSLLSRQTMGPHVVVKKPPFWVQGFNVIITFVIFSVLPNLPPNNLKINVTMVLLESPFFIPPRKPRWCKVKGDIKETTHQLNKIFYHFQVMTVPKNVGVKHLGSELFQRQKVARFRKTWPKALGMTPRNSSDSSLPTMVCVLPVPVWP